MTYHPLWNLSWLLGAVVATAWLAPQVPTTPAAPGASAPHPPERIVSGYLAADELLAELVEPSRVHAVTASADFPGMSNVVGHYPDSTPRLQSFNAEAITLMAPDLVLASSFNAPTALQLLGNTAVPVLRQPELTTFDELFASILAIGHATHTRSSAERLVADLRQRLAAIRDQPLIPQPSVLVVSYGFSPGLATLDHARIEAAGATNALAETGLRGHIRVSDETIVLLSPDIIVVPGSDPSLIARIRENPRLASVAAVREGRVLLVPSELFSSMSHHAVRGVEVLHATLRDSLEPTDAE